MDRAWVDQLLEKLGPRYKAGDVVGEGIELRYRFGKAEFRPSRMVVIPGQKLQLGVDFRVPKGVEVKETEPLLVVLEQKSLAPRGFVRTGDQTSEMTTEAGKASGYVRSLAYEAPLGGTEEVAKRIRAIVESIDIPVVLGIHEAKDLIAREPPPPSLRAKAGEQVLDNWEFTLVGGLLASVNVVIDPNVRTLQIVARKIVSKEERPALKLASVAQFLLRAKGAEVELVAVKRDGAEEVLVAVPAKAEALETAERMAKKVLIPIARV